MKKLWVRLSLTNAAISVLVVTVLLGAIFAFRFIDFNIGEPNRPAPPQVASRDQEGTAGAPANAGSPDERRPPRGPAEWPLFVGIMLGSIALGVLSGVVASRTISNPISSLARATQQFSARNLSVRAPVEGSQEIATLARSFNDMARRLQASDEQRKRMLADISHELRTPLTVLKGHLRAQLDGVYVLTESDTANLYGQVEHLIHLVEDLRLLTLAETGQVPLHFEVADMAAVVGECLALFEPAAQEAGVALTLGPGAASLIRMDSARVRQVLTNLVANALQHTPVGGHILVSLTTEHARLRVTVADSGAGIAPDALPHVFDRFYRADTSRTRDNGGTGLGLAIVKALIEAQDGSVGAESTIDKGSKFWFTLPQAREFDTKHP